MDEDKRVILEMVEKEISYNYNIYIQEIYDKTRLIVNNYFQILGETKYFLEDHQKTLNEIIQFLEKKRVDFRVIRCEVRSIIRMDTFYSKNDNYADFMRGVLGVLQGGLESEMLANRDIDEIYHNHTINDIIEECKMKKKYENDSNKIELCSELIESICEQEEELGKAWELVYQSYVKINGSKLNRLIK